MWLMSDKSVQRCDICLRTGRANGDWGNVSAFWSWWVLCVCVFLQIYIAILILHKKFGSYSERRASCDAMQLLMPYRRLWLHGNCCTTETKTKRKKEWTWMDWVKSTQYKTNLCVVACENGSLTTNMRRTTPLLVCAIAPFTSFWTVMLLPSANCK